MAPQRCNGQALIPGTYEYVSLRVNLLTEASQSRAFFRLEPERCSAIGGRRGSQRNSKTDMGLKCCCLFWDAGGHLQRPKRGFWELRATHCWQPVKANRDLNPTTARTQILPTAGMNLGVDSSPESAKKNVALPTPWFALMGPRAEETIEPSSAQTSDPWTLQDNKWILS